MMAFKPPMKVLSPKEDQPLYDLAASSETLHKATTQPPSTAKACQALLTTSFQPPVRRVPPCVLSADTDCEPGSKIPDQ